MNKAITFSFCFLFCTVIQTFCSAQTGIGKVRSVRQEDNKIFFSGANADVQLEFCTEGIIRIRTSWEGEFEENEPWMVSRYEWPGTITETREQNDEYVIKTPLLSIHIQKNPFQLDIYDKEGNILSSENIPSGGGFAEGKSVGSAKKLFPGESFFGFGERMDFLDRRGKKVRLNVGRGLGRPHIIGAYNVLEANYSPVPFFMSTRGYGIFFHNAWPTTWDMGSGSDEMYSFQAEGGELDYYFMYGPDFPSILDSYTSITGKSPLLPYFGLGLQVGTYSGGTWGHEEQTSDQYPVELVKKFRDMGIPIDVLHLDSTWRIFGKNGGSGATTFEWRETFKNPEAMFDSLYAQNLHMVGLHVRPRFDNGNELDLLDQARKKGFTYPENGKPGEFVNFFDKKSVDWWWENGAMRVAGIGAMFFKTDEGSAFGRKANESNKTGPQGESVKMLHNIFPVAYAKAPYKKFAEQNNMRGMDHTREGYAGIQRYPFIFAGDWPSEWQYFEPVIKAGLNIGLSGVGYWAHCSGGFEHEADPELYIRWTQFGLLSPVAHLFGMDHPTYKEPWSYGEEALEIFRKYTKLRYSLLPYLYSYSYEMYTRGTPLMRALVLHYQDDTNVYNITDQYLLGRDLMICPVTTKGARTRVVYLPEGNWTNYWTGETHNGKQYLNVVCPLDQMPVFVREGAIIPSQKPVNYVGEETIDTITLDIYPGEKSSFDLYDDDGISTDYQKGNYAITRISAEKNPEGFAIDIKTPEGKYKVADRSYRIKVPTDKKPASVAINGKKAAVEYSEKEKTLTISPETKSKKDIRIIIK
ncbi:glycoside hydrolase family 31 protein [Sinomicrobium sp. M5D2P17]